VFTQDPGASLGALPLELIELVLGSSSAYGPTGRRRWRPAPTSPACSRSTTAGFEVGGIRRGWAPSPRAGDGDARLASGSLGSGDDRRGRRAVPSPPARPDEHVHRGYEEGLRYIDLVRDQRCAMLLDELESSRRISEEHDAAVHHQRHIGLSLVDQAIEVRCGLVRIEADRDESPVRLRCRVARPFG
jgi:hypothetical protein